MRFLTWLATAGLLASALAIGCNPEPPTNSNSAGPPSGGPKASDVPAAGAPAAALRQRPPDINLPSWSRAAG